MTQPNDLHARLDALNADILKARIELKQKNAWHDGHNLTSGELEARYKFLKSKVDADVADLEAHGRHVSKLEGSVRQWLVDRNPYIPFRKGDQNYAN
ncbi:hypothetical protein EDD52_13319 [Primorskyibacter sedentarius]|uniref:Uncharacterized protein n=1 Tax=Primorskyibacter sedentarius TaxID=745311 RepID=A0A4R3ITV0_9RHOB|nr:3-ketoacyl-ACP reductase [Primorskyibacter sedentarius]TCS54480.1 hypothetical protein EDD52_13319 [Primorskyibacter sedentarius]